MAGSAGEVNSRAGVSARFLTTPWSVVLAADQRAVFGERECCLLGDRPTETYAELGPRLGLSEAAVKVTVHRLRQQYRELLREEVAHTVADQKELEAEMRYLLEVVSR